MLICVVFQCKHLFHSTQYSIPLHTFMAANGFFIFFFHFRFQLIHRKKKEEIIHALFFLKKIATRINIQAVNIPPSQWCVCRQPSFGQMIFCDNPTCLIKWFHMDCVKIQVVPEGNWYCQNCNLLQKK